MGLKTAENVLMHKTCLTSQFLRFSLARFSRKMAYLPSRKNLANENLRNCDVRQVLCIKTFSAVFKPKNVCIFAKFSSFQSFQSEIILVKCCKEASVPLKLVFFRIFRVQEGIFLCVSLCIYFVRMKIHSEVANLVVIIYILRMMTTQQRIGQPVLKLMLVLTLHTSLNKRISMCLYLRLVKTRF